MMEKKWKSIITFKVGSETEKEKDKSMRSDYIFYNFHIYIRDQNEDQILGHIYFDRCAVNFK